MASPPAMSPSKASPLEASPSASASAYRSERPDNSAGEGMQVRGPAPAQISSVIDSLKKQVATDRCVHIKKRMEENRQKMVEVTNNLFKSAQERRYLKSTDTDASVVNLLEKRQKDAIDMQNNLDKNGDNDSESSQEDGHGSAAILLGASIAVKNVVQPIKLAEVKKVPPYTTWIFLDRNQRMTEDQSVFGRRRIYYDQSGGEALIASDSDEEVIDEDEEKKEFVDSEDYILRMTIKEVGVADAVWDALAWCFSRKPCEVKARYEVLTKRENATGASQEGHIEDVSNSFLDRDLDTALDSFDNLFCRRCLVFDCRLHGCSQDLIFPAEKQLPWSPPPNEESTPCGLRCYRQVPSSDGVGSQISRRQSSGTSLRRRAKGVQSESATTSNAKSVSESSESESRPIEEDFLEKRGGINKRNSLQIVEHVVTTVRKRQKNMAINSDSDDTLKKCNFVDENITNKEVVNDIKSWKAFEISLFEKGLEIFGRNSCLIARNLLNGMKTCSEVFHFMNHSENKLSSEAVNGSDSSGEGNSKGDGNDNLGTQFRRRSRFLRRRGRVRRLKYSWKSTGYHSFKKRISEKKDQPCRQYNPCGCQTACGKECSCLLNGTCCEKYCGCPRSCKNRFRGCHCAKSQCRSRQCPCFAAGRECDPDVCRNCWISCGDGTLGIPWQRGDNYECRNMKLLLKQQQRVLLGRSDVSGWGAFLKKCVAKHEYLGEYTGELISHREADKRGKIYDRVNSSFLFNLNDQFVLDAFRKGDKLKFANHSPDPNCYAKVIMVAGDHRVGIFAKERIMAGEELFYDYRYEADRAPAWAKKPETSGSKKEEHTPSNGRAKKIA